MYENSEVKPADLLEELQKILCQTVYEVHRVGDGSEEYQYLTEGDVCITIHNPYQDKKLYIDLTEEFTLTYSGFHCHYEPELTEYQELLSDVQGILNNEICSAVLYYIDQGKRWLGSTCSSKAELSRPVKDIFYFVYQQAEFRKKLKEYGGKAEFCFWNPQEDFSIDIPKRL